MQRLAEMWIESPLIQQEIADAADVIDGALGSIPHGVGMATPGRARFVVRPPLTALYRVREEDSEVRVFYVKFWDD